MGDRGSKKAYTRARSGMYLHTKFGCDRSIMVGCRSWNDRQTNKHPGTTTRLTIRDATDGRRDGIAMAYTRYSYTVARKNACTDVQKTIFNRELQSSKDEAVRIMLDCLQNSEMSWFRKFKEALRQTGQY